MKSNYICVYVSPITDMLDTRVNHKNIATTPLNAYPVLNNSLLLYTRSSINMKDNNGILTKYYTVSNEKVFFQYNYIYDDYKKYKLNKYLYTKSIDIIVPKKIIEGIENKKITTCQLLNICPGLLPIDKNTLKMSNFISSSYENPNLINFGRLLFLDEKFLNENDKDKFQFFIKSFSRGTKINNENEYLAYLFYFDQLNKEIPNFKNFFKDIITNQKDINKNNDLFRLVELNLKVVLANYIFLLDKMERLLNNEIIDNIQKI